MWGARARTLFRQPRWAGLITSWITPASASESLERLLASAFNGSLSMSLYVLIGNRYFLCKPSSQAAVVFEFLMIRGGATASICAAGYWAWICFSTRSRARFGQLMRNEIFLLVLM